MLCIVWGVAPLSHKEVYICNRAILNLLIALTVSSFLFLYFHITIDKKSK